MKKLCCWALLAALLLGGCTRPAAPREEPPAAPPAAEQPPAGPAVALPTAEELLAALCAPAFQGCAVGSAGNELAAGYIASCFEGLGLEPLFDDYLQPYEEQCVRTERAEARAALIAADGTRTELTAGTDFLFYPVYEGVEVRLPVSEDAAACEDRKSFFMRRNTRRRGTSPMTRRGISPSPASIWRRPGA